MISAHLSFGKPKTPELIAGILNVVTFVSFANSNVLMMQLLSKLGAFFLPDLE